MYDYDDDEEYYARQTQKAEAAFDLLMEVACAFGLAYIVFWIFKHV